MPKINLLPWREERRAERQRQFLSVLSGSLILAGLVFFIGFRYANNLLSVQESRNHYLQQEISLIDEQIKSVAELESAREQLIEKMHVIESLQFSRPAIVKVFDAVAQELPEGIYLESFSREGSALILEGVAQSNPRVSILMRALEENILFNSPQLEVVQRVSNQNEATRKFVLRIEEASATQAEKEGDIDVFIE